MENNLHVEIVSRENIKPSSPTPPNLKTFNLSLFDQRAPPVYTTLVLFYQISTDAINNNIIITTLKKSLSEALTSYVPLAGKIDNINNSNIVECTDQGAIFIEAKSKTILSTFLEENPNEDLLLERLLPAKTRSAEAATSPLLLVQATLFECGGLAIGLCMSHKLADAATLCMFLKNWSNPAQRFTLTVPKEFDISPESIWFPLPRDQRNNNNNNNIESLMIKTVNKSWCNFGFYEVNFGWGKPIWAWRPSSSNENVLKLMDTKNGGVEVSLTLSKENMALFERDPHILAFANPSHPFI
ncbi:salutaridinol 7-O-acetyltransferase [Cannabis sativa]|uniref:salutaridinol 7-O-acetyltransferase n=1 Tax=Cannabis sativa TaxID=3483 RepID=UPI0029CA8B80|nr:salutaridinol 7-O-acetyltransferase [Cannabis sativa]